jgi:hypothetical protein
VPSGCLTQVDGASNSQEELVTDPQPALVLPEEMRSSLEASQGGEEEGEKSIQEVKYYIGSTQRGFRGSN